ncbi:hypothetical protein [Cysteiniphilum sp. 6C5]|uniref:hypothetical protein n=1 Tax=unclassified Cysteiniphilum TaxID=2610889 RepID=UPI003F86E39C
MKEMNKEFKEGIKTAAASLLGFTSSYQPQHHTSKITVLLNSFVDGAIQEVYRSCDWAFGIDTLSKDKLQQVDSSFILRLGNQHVVVFSGKYQRVIATAPSGFNFTLHHHGVVFKLKSPIDNIAQGITLGDIAICPDWLVLYYKNLPTHIEDPLFTNLCALCLAAQIAYSAYGDANYADATKKQYINALQQAQVLNRYQSNIDNMSRVL